MIRRKGEITRGDLKRKWRHHVALPAEKVLDRVNREVIFCAAGVVARRAFGVAGFLHTTVHDHFDRRSGARKFGTRSFRRLSRVALHQRKRARAVPARRNSRWRVRSLEEGRTSGHGCQYRADLPAALHRNREPIARPQCLCSRQQHDRAPDRRFAAWCRVAIDFVAVFIAQRQ